MKIDRVETHTCHTFTFEEIATALGLKGRIVYLQAETDENPLRFKGTAQIHVVGSDKELGGSAIPSAVSRYLDRPIECHYADESLRTAFFHGVDAAQGKL